MRRLSRFAVLTAASFAAVSCTDATTATEPIARGRIALAPSFSASAVQAYNALPAFGLEITSVRLMLTAPDGSTRDTTFSFPADANELRIELAVPIRTAGQRFRADLELRNDQGQVLFRGTQDVVAQASNVPGNRNAPAAVEIQYTGPGTDVRTLVVTPSASTMTGAGTLPLAATATNATGVDVPDFLVRWTSSDASLATVAQSGNTSALVTSAGRRGTVTVSAITPLGITGTARITLVPGAARLVVISGGTQTGPAGTTLPQPLVVEVQASDNLPVPGVSVAFRAVTAGASVATATAVTDQSGRASTALALGPTAGPYQFEASSASLTAVTASQTATSAPAASLLVASGDAQQGGVGTLAPLPLAVRVLDRFGAPVSGATVAWARVSGAGSLGGATSTTDASGVASNSYTFGDRSGTETVRASLPGSTSGSAQATFTLQADAGPPANITAAGEGQRAPAGNALNKPLAVRVTDAFGNAIAGADVLWRVRPGSNGAATFLPQISRTTNLGTAETVVTLGSIVGPMTIQAVVGGLVHDFAVIVDPPVQTGSPGAISGYVYDAVNGNPLGGVSVTTSQFSVTTAADGRFTSPQVPSGNYDVTFTAQGYVTTPIVGLRVDGNTVTEAVPLVPASSSPGGISGRIIDATTGGNISGGAVVELRPGMNATRGTPLQTQTVAGASYQFDNVAAGTYTVAVRATGYADASKTGIAVGAQTTSNQNIFVSPAGAVGQVRIVLTWRATPRDLDSYLTGPSGSSRFTVYYGGQGNCSGAPFACLDQDVTSGFGPETMTITQVLTGRYRFSVNDYTNRRNSSSTALSQSGARVDVYLGNTLARSFSVPAGAGTDWTVFDLDGTTITTINTIGGPNRTSIPLPTGISASRSASEMGVSAADDRAIIAELIRKNPKRRAPR